MTIKYLSGLRKKIDSWKENEQNEIKEKAKEMYLQASVSLISNLPPEIQNEFASKLASRENSNFYLNIATLKRYQDMPFGRGLKTILYSTLDKII